jgi:hypothetical protein
MATTKNPSLNEIGHYVVTSHPPGAVLSAAKCDFFGDGSLVSCFIVRIDDWSGVIRCVIGDDGFMMYYGCFVLLHLSLRISDMLLSVLCLTVVACLECEWH